MNARAHRCDSILSLLHAFIRHDWVNVGSRVGPARNNWGAQIKNQGRDELQSFFLPIYTFAMYSWSALRRLLLVLVGEFRTSGL